MTVGPIRKVLKLSYPTFSKFVAFFHTDLWSFNILFKYTTNNLCFYSPKIAFKLFINFLHHLPTNAESIYVFTFSVMF